MPAATDKVHANRCRCSSRFHARIFEYAELTPLPRLEKTGRTGFREAGVRCMARGICHPVTIATGLPRIPLAKGGGSRYFSGMSKVAEIQSALKELSLHDAEEVARWLQSYLGQQGPTPDTGPAQTPLQLPDYAARRKMIFGDKVLPNMVMLGRELERW